HEHAAGSKLEFVALLKSQ
ncbi:hypothetical protein A2U01_0087067, partial [Trifolium medium]|nr:hypothetical protein [Trifolium medium]